MSLNVQCAWCGQPTEVEYLYDRVVLHICRSCKSKELIVIPSIIAKPPTAGDS